MIHIIFCNEREPEGPIDIYTTITDVIMKFTYAHGHRVRMGVQTIRT